MPAAYSFTNSDFTETPSKDTYLKYEPGKLKIGVSHSYDLIESRSLRCVAPPDITHKLSLPQQIITSGLLTNIQLEAIIYACQKHETFLADGKRAGFLLGDGAGVGKGRTIAGIIYENALAGRHRSIWISVSYDLEEDAKRDFRDIGSDIKVISGNGLSYKDDTDNNSNNNQVLFVTYKALLAHTQLQKDNYFSTRLDQITKWFGEEYDGVMVFDECHKAKNLSLISSKSQTATNVQILQDNLRRARIVYSSATGATESGHLRYMSRLGLWGDGQICSRFEDFDRNVKKHGVSSMDVEIHCKEMHTFSQPSIDNGARIVISQVKYVKNGVSWPEALQRYNVSPSKNYFCTLFGQKCDLIGLVVDANESTVKLITPIFPSEVIDTPQIMNKWKKVTMEKAELVWKFLHFESLHHCLHSLMENSVCMKHYCTYGKRTISNFMISDAISTAIHVVDKSSANVHINLARLQVNTNESMIGAFFTPKYYPKILELFNKRYLKTETVQHIEEKYKILVESEKKAVKTTRKITATM